MNTKNKILLGIPTNRMIQPQTMLSLLKLVQNTKQELVIVLATNGYTIAENRNFLVVQAQKEGCSHLLMIDDDMLFPQTMLDDLLKHNKDFVGVCAHSRTLPPMSMVTLFDQEEIPVADRLLGRQKLPTELFTAKAVGGAVLLLKTSLFDKVSRPWFANENYDTGMTRVGEDYYFCNKVVDAGIDIWIDPQIPIGHIGNYVY